MDRLSVIEIRIRVIWAASGSFQRKEQNQKQKPKDFFVLNLDCEFWFEYQWKRNGQEEETDKDVTI